MPTRIHPAAVVLKQPCKSKEITSSSWSEILPICAIQLAGPEHRKRNMGKRIREVFVVFRNRRQTTNCCWRTRGRTAATSAEELLEQTRALNPSQRRLRWYVHWYQANPVPGERHAQIAMPWPSFWYARHDSSAVNFTPAELSGGE